MIANQREFMPEAGKILNRVHLEIKEGYKFEKVLVIYNLFTKDLSNQILNNKNKIVVGKNSELHTINYTINRSKNKFINIKKFLKQKTINQEKVA